MFEVWDSDGLGAIDDPVKAAVTAGGCLSQWKQAGRPQNVNFCSKTYSTGLVAQPGQIVTTMPAPQLPSATGGGLQAPATAPKAEGGLMDTLSTAFSNIPPTLLYVGGAVIIFMMLKKR
jgi:hypothetical protein